MADTPNDGAPAAPQRRWEAPCPNCGAPVAFQSAASPVAICGYCRSTVVRDGDALRKIGESAELFDDRSALQLGTSGQFQNRGFTLIGRLQLGYGGSGAGDVEGRWNEWHALFDDQRNGWLSEDNDQYVFVFDVDGDPGAPPSVQLQPGRSVQLAGKPWRVASRVQARALAAEGELPSPPALGVAVPIVDLRNEQDQVATLEYPESGPPKLSIGQSVRLDALQLKNLRDGFGAGTQTLHAQGFPCPECGAPIEVKLAETQSLTCGNCKSVVDVSKGVGAELTAYRQGQTFEPLIPLGRTGVLSIAGGPAVPWQVVGFAVRRGQQAMEQFRWYDYLLFNREAGFAFLADTSEGWIGFRTLTGAPKKTAEAVIWKDVHYRADTASGEAIDYRADDHFYTAKVLYVEGEFYWRVTRNQTQKVADYISFRSSSERLSCEQSDAEIVWSEGNTIPASLISSAFGLATTAASVDRDVRPYSGARLGSWVVWLIVIIIVLILLSRCGGGGGGYYYGTGGGSYGGYSSGGGHK